MPSPTSSPSAPGRHSTSPTSRSPSACSCSSSSTCATPSRGGRRSRRPVVAEPALRVVHLDEDLAVVDKPAGLVVHPAPSHRGPTLVDELAEILGGGEESERPGIVHRLDRGTSGLMVVARSDATHAALQAQVRRREVERLYLALARGHLSSRTGTIDAPIGRPARQRHRMAVSGAAPREARTHFTVLELLA